MAEQPAHPESIVSTQWVADNLGDANVRLVEVDVDTAAYDQGHIPGAVGWNWTTQLNDQLTRDILTREQMESLLGSSGIANGTTVVLYGDNNNWFATYAFWQMRMYGHGDLKIMDGGRQKWIDEGREVTTDATSVEAATYSASNPDTSIRATRDYVLGVASTDNNTGLVDVRAPDEFNGTLLAPANLPQEGSQRGGHIPARRTSRGRRLSPRTARSSLSKSSERYTKARGSPARARPSPTAASGSAARTPGSFSARSWGTARCGTTTALGPSTAPSSERR